MRMVPPLLFLVLLAAVVLPGVPGIGSFLRTPPPPELIYVLSGEAEPRLERAAELYLHSPGSKIAFPETAGTTPGAVPWNMDVTEYSRFHLMRLGVPERDILMVPFDGGVGSTRDEGCALRSYLRTSPTADVVVVTSAYHALRAGWTVRAKLRGAGSRVTIVAAASIDPRSDPGRRLYRQEYRKLALTMLGEVVFRGCYSQRVQLAPSS
jgi:uncharacterized SAM-binding protein YcdF (DUF218 family)